MNQALPDGTSALVLAVMNAHYELAGALLDKGADPNADKQGWTALHQIAWSRRHNAGFNLPGPVATGGLDSLDLVRKLVQKGANVNARMTKEPRDGNRNQLNRIGSTAFLMAAKSDDVPLMRVLLESGADPSLTTERGTTALMAAAGVGIWAPGENPGTHDEALAAVKLALEAGGGKVNDIDQDGETALHGAVYRGGAIPVIQFLIDKGATLDVKNKKGWTPVVVADGVEYTPAVLKRYPEAAALLRKTMRDRGLPVPPPTHSAERSRRPRIAAPGGGKDDLGRRLHRGAGRPRTDDLHRLLRAVPQGRSARRPRNTRARRRRLLLALQRVERGRSGEDDPRLDAAGCARLAGHAGLRRSGRLSAQGERRPGGRHGALAGFGGTEADSDHEPKITVGAGLWTRLGRSCGPARRIDVNRHRTRTVVLSSLVAVRPRCHDGRRRRDSSRRRAAARGRPPAPRRPRQFPEQLHRDITVGNTKDMSSSRIKFDAGARTNWHLHSAPNCCWSKRDAAVCRNWVRRSRMCLPDSRCSPSRTFSTGTARRRIRRRCSSAFTAARSSGKRRSRTRSITGKTIRRQ